MTSHAGAQLNFDFCVPPLHLDPPEHTRSKKLLATAFTPSAVQMFAEPIRAAVVEVLAGLDGQEMARSTCASASHAELR